MYLNCDGLGNMIKNIRRDKKIKQTDLAKAIGKSVETVKKYESGAIEPPLNVIRLIEAALSVEQGSLTAPVYHPLGEKAFSSLLTSIGAEFSYPTRETLNSNREVVKTEDLSILLYKGAEYNVPEDSIDLLREEVIDYIEYKIQKLITESETNIMRGR